MSGFATARARVFNRAGNGGAQLFDLEKRRFEKLFEKTEVFAERLKDKHWFTRVSGLNGLFLSGKAEAFPFLLKSLKDNDSRVSTEAFYLVLEFLKEKGSVPLIYSLNDECNFVRFASAFLLGKKAGGSAVEALQARLQKEEDARVKIALLLALQQCIRARYDEECKRGEKLSA
ncbi:hypothetical protein HY992_00835 [Candidatus Micrarchaeota archaeon]|nr:hypothetical protein [Candidatus Micrarchaeota archaeon]